MDVERRKCTVDACELLLRSNNTTGYCTEHKVAKNRPSSDGDTPPTARAPKKPKAPPAAANGKEAVERLLRVTEALGVDGDALVSEFVEAYLERLRTAAQGEG